MVIRHLQYLTALARERHFARAAAMCNVTQPTLSTGIKQLEESLGVLIVERGQRFLGLTAEGERVLAWAQRVLTDFSSLQQELSEMREGLVGQLRIGAIPVALPIVPLLTTPFAHRYERTDIQVVSLNSISIQRSLDDFSLDAGVTYLDNEPLARVRCIPLYADASRRRVGRSARRHVVGGSEPTSVPTDTRHAKSAHPRHAFSPSRRRNPCGGRNQLARHTMVPSAFRPLVKRGTAYLSASVGGKRWAGCHPTNRAGRLASDRLGRLRPRPAAPGRACPTEHRSPPRDRSHNRRSDRWPSVVNCTRQSKSSITRSITLI